MKNFTLNLFFILLSSSLFAQTGNVGVGTVTPDRKLHVSNSNSATMRLEDTRKAGSRGPTVEMSDGNGTSATIDFYLDGSGGVRDNAVEVHAGGNGRINFTTGSTILPDLTIINDGKVGVGEPAPTAKLHVSGVGGSTEPHIIIQDSDDATAMVQQVFAILRETDATLTSITPVGAGIGGVSTFEVSIGLTGGITGTFHMNSSGISPSFHLAGYGNSGTVITNGSNLVTVDLTSIGAPLQLQFSLNTTSSDLEVIKSGGTYTGDINIAILQKKVQF